MPPIETRGRSLKLADYTECFRAPSAKQADVEILLKECAKYQVKGPPMPLVNLDQRYVEYNFETEAAGHLRLQFMEAPLPSFRYVNGNMRQMQLLEDDLAEKQGVQLPPKKHASMRDHASAIHALAGNVEIIDDIVTNNRRGKKSRRPAWFIENDIPHPTKNKQIRTDLVIVTSDNRVRPFEIGRAENKVGQVMNQVGGLAQHYRNLTRDHLPPERIVPYVVQYQINDAGLELQIYPVQRLHEEIAARRNREVVYDAALAAD